MPIYSYYGTWHISEGKLDSVDRAAGQAEGLRARQHGEHIVSTDLTLEVAAGRSARPRIGCVSRHRSSPPGITIGPQRFCLFSSQLNFIVEKIIAQN